MGPLLRSASGVTLGLPMMAASGVHSTSNRRSLDLTQGLSPVRTMTLPVLATSAGAAAPSLPQVNPASPAPAAAGHSTADDAAILQQLIDEIARLKKELSKER